MAFAFAVGLLLGALAVVVLMDHYRAAVRPRFEGLGTRPVVIRTSPPAGGVRVIHTAAPPPRRARPSLPATTPWPNTPNEGVASRPPTVPSAVAHGPSPGYAYAPPAPVAAAAASLAPGIPDPNGFRRDAAVAPTSITAAPMTQVPIARAPIAQAPAPQSPSAWAPAAMPSLPPKTFGEDVAPGTPAMAAPTVPAPAKKVQVSPRKRRIKPATKRPARATPVGHIVVETRPASKGQVAVQVDGTPRGSAPLRLGVPPGVHEVQTTYADGYPEMRMVRVESGGTARIVVPIAPQAP